MPRILTGKINGVIFDAARLVGKQPCLSLCLPVYRRLAEPDFRAQVETMRTEMVQRVAGMLTAAGLGSVKTFAQLQESAVSEAVRLGAARAIVELGCKVRESVELARRLTHLEIRLEQLVEEILQGTR